MIRDEQVTRFPNILLTIRTTIHVSSRGQMRPTFKVAIKSYVVKKLLHGVDPQGGEGS